MWFLKWVVTSTCSGRKLFAGIQKINLKSIVTTKISYYSSFPHRKDWSEATYRIISTRQGSQILCIEWCQTIGGDFSNRSKKIVCFLKKKKL